MIKTLRYAFVAALLMISGAANAQTESTVKTQDLTIVFFDLYKDLDKKGKNNDTGYLKDTNKESNGIKFTYAPSTGSSAPNFTFTNKKDDAFTAGYVKLFGGNEGNVEGNQMTVSSENRKIVSIKLIGTNASDWGTLSASSGSITFTGTDKNPNLYPTWKCADGENGVSEITFTISRDNANTKAKHVRYTKAIVTVIDDASVIKATLNNKKASDTNRYNLAGQRVDESYKGIVIKDGKKTVQ